MAKRPSDAQNEDTPSPKRPRTEELAVFHCYPDLLPELRSLIIRALDDIDDYYYVSICSRQCYLEAVPFIPRIPADWKTTLLHARYTYHPDISTGVRGAISLGVHLWPGIARIKSSFRDELFFDLDVNPDLNPGVCLRFIGHSVIAVWPLPNHVLTMESPDRPDHATDWETECTSVQRGTTTSPHYVDHAALVRVLETMAYVKMVAAKRNEQPIAAKWWRLPFHILRTMAITYLSPQDRVAVALCNWKMMCVLGCTIPRIPPSWKELVSHAHAHSYLGAQLVRSRIWRAIQLGVHHWPGIEHLVVTNHPGDHFRIHTPNAQMAFERTSLVATTFLPARVSSNINGSLRGQSGSYAVRYQDVADRQISIDCIMDPIRRRALTSARLVLSYVKSVAERYQYDDAVRMKK